MVLGALLALAAVAAARPPLTPARYKTAVVPISSCRAFEQRFAGLPYATPLFDPLFAEGIPEQKPSETSDDFVNRIVDRMFARLGDPSRVYVSVPLADHARYDFARELLIVTFPVPYEATLDRAGGARVLACPPGRRHWAGHGFGREKMARRVPSGGA